MATEYYEKALKLAKEQRDNRQVVEANIGLGESYKLNDDVNLQTIEFYEKALKIAEERKDKRQEAEAYLGLGDAYKKIQSQTAIEYYGEALRIANERKDNEQEVDAYLGLGDVYKLSNQFQTAMEHYEKALTIARERGDKRQETDAFLGVGAAFKLSNQLQPATEHFKEALKIAEERQDKRQETEAFLELGDAYKLSNEIPIAIEYFEKALKIAMEREDKRQEADACLRLGETYKLDNRTKPAIDYYEEALKIAKEQDDKRQEVDAYLWLGHAYKWNDQIELAMNYYEKALKISTEQEDKRQEAEAYLGFGDAYRLNDQIQLAIENYEKALKIAKEQDDKRQETDVYLWLGHTYKLKNQIQITIEYYEKALKIAKEQGDNRQETEAYLGLGNVLKLAEKEGHKEIDKADVHSSSTTIPPKDDSSTPSSQTTKESPKHIEVQWTERSKNHSSKLSKLINVLKTEPSKATRIGTYHVCFEDEYSIGKGSDGTEVYVGLSDDGFEVAIKCINLEKWRKLGDNEKKILNCPNVRKEKHIVNYRFYQEMDSKKAYLVLDLHEESLQNYVLTKERSVEQLQEEGPSIIRQILYGVRALHCSNPEILHRDLKPSNILVNIEGEMVLADFGISRALPQDVTTYMSGVMGTAGWMAVESLPTEDDDDDASDVDIRVRYKKTSDIQVVGMLCYYILTKGKHPYGSRIHQLSNISKGDFDLKNVSDPCVKDLITWMLQHDPRKRPTVDECLKHPYLRTAEENFNFVEQVGNEKEINTKDAGSAVVQELNKVSIFANWSTVIDPCVMAYMSLYRRSPYTNNVADLVRFARNMAAHWHNQPPPENVRHIVVKPQEYFQRKFPTLSVELHRILRNRPDWTTRDNLESFFK